MPKFYPIQEDEPDEDGWMQYSRVPCPDCDGKLEGIDDSGFYTCQDCGWEGILDGV